MSRYLSFKFDDGFLDGMRKAVRILDGAPASFFLISGLVDQSVSPEGDPLFRGRNFGSVEDWRALAEFGHDIQPHGVAHLNFQSLPRARQEDEIRGSLALVREIGAGPYVFGFPFNVRTDLDFRGLGLSGAGFGCRGSDRNIQFNLIAEETFDPFRLNSWAVRERHADVIPVQLDAAPDQSWTILTLHSLDGEGHEPWTSEGFAWLAQTVRELGFQITSVGEMVRRRREGEIAAQGGAQSDTSR